MPVKSGWDDWVSQTFWNLTDIKVSQKYAHDLGPALALSKALKILNDFALTFFTCAKKLQCPAKTKERPKSPWWSVSRRHVPTSTTPGTLALRAWQKGHVQKSGDRAGRACVMTGMTMRIPMMMTFRTIFNRFISVRRDFSISLTFTYKAEASPMLMAHCHQGSSDTRAFAHLHNNDIVRSKAQTHVLEILKPADCIHLYWSATHPMPRFKGRGSGRKWVCGESHGDFSICNLKERQ